MHNHKISKKSCLCSLDDDTVFPSALTECICRCSKQGQMQTQCKIHFMWRTRSLESKKKTSTFYVYLLWRRQWHPHCSTLAWKIPWTEEPGRLQSMESLRVGHDWVTSVSLFTLHWWRKWQPTPGKAWRIPGTGEPGGLPSMGSHRVGHDWSDLA